MDRRTRLSLITNKRTVIYIALAPLPHKYLEVSTLISEQSFEPLLGNKKFTSVVRVPHRIQESTLSGRGIFK